MPIAILTRFAPYIIGFLIIAGLYWRYSWAINRAEDFETQNALLQQNIAQQEQARETLHNHYLKADEARKKADATIAALRRNTRSQVARIDEVNRSEPVKPWADTSLPLPVSNLLRAATSSPPSNPSGSPGPGTD